ncbi:unnamed protein product [Orchesella dallaii]|uniref:RNA-directed DNA polymerase n=1 Tax=Orchesella dallaii TaxID=48710 RepID=A0ABP1RUG3_9HEXA
MLQGIADADSYIDDVLCGGKQNSDSIITLKAVFQRIREYNYFLSKEKCEFLQDNVEFLGHILSKRGVHTSPRRIEAMIAIQRPQTVTELKSFLGLVNFYGKFVHNFADFCEPLYKLTRSNVEWQWTKSCDRAFERVKQVLSSSETLVHFDPQLPIGISCDASSKGLGCVLFHRVMINNKPVEKAIAYGSRIMSTTEQNYSQIEKEGLSIMFGLKKFYKFLCGRRFTLITDHKPLLAIFGSKSHLQSYAAARLHRWSIFMSQFEYDIQYRSTAEHGNADALSRLPTTTAPVEDDDSHEVNLIAQENMEILPVTSGVIRNSTAKDPILSRVLSFTQSKWPTKLSTEDAHLQPYFTRRHELSTQQGVLLWGIRVVIPTSIRKKLLDSLHETHAGIVRMKAHARQYIWWPSIDNNIEVIAKSCVECCSSRADPPSAPLHPWQFPERPWQRLHVDLAGPFLGKMFRIIVDSHSKWPEVYDLNVNTTSTSVLRKLSDSFVRFGIPEQLVSDNGSQFVSAEFQRFCKNNGIRHITSSAYHPRTNGEAERFIQTFKRAMLASKDDLTCRLQRFLFSCRCTPHATTGSSPSELLLGRKPRSLLDLVRPDVKQTVAAAQARQEESYNHRVKSRSFEEGEEVWVKTYSKNQSKWSLGKIVKFQDPVSFLVDVGGQVYKRHVDQLYQAMRFQLTPQSSPDPSSPSPSSSSPPSCESSHERQCKSEPTSPLKVEAKAQQHSSVPVPQPIDPEVENPPNTRPRRKVKAPERFGYQDLGRPRHHSK